MSDSKTEKIYPKIADSLTVNKFGEIIAVTVDKKDYTYFIPAKRWHAITKADDPYEAALRPPVAWTLVDPEYTERVLSQGPHTMPEYRDEGDYYYIAKDIDLAKFDPDTALFHDSYDGTFWDTSHPYPITVPQHIEFWGSYWDLEKLEEKLAECPYVLSAEIVPNPVAPNWEISGRYYLNASIHLPQDIYDRLNEYAAKHMKSYREGVKASFYEMQSFFNAGASEGMDEDLRDVLGIADCKKPRDDYSYDDDDDSYDDW